MNKIEGNVVWTQEGKCSPQVCDAWCCRHVSWKERAKDIDPSDIRWYKYHGIQVKRIGDMLHFLMVVDCDKLDPKTLKCTIYNTRPHSCRSYARKPSDAFASEQCGFHWRLLSPEEAKCVIRRMRRK